MMAALAPHVAETLRSSDARIVITGAGGWIGMATLDLLAACLGQDLSSRVMCFGATGRTLRLSNGGSIEQRALSEIAALEPVPTIVLHLAFLTKDRAEDMDEAAYWAANRAVDETVLAALDPVGAEAIFVASSGAAYRADDPFASPAMRSYGALKCGQEELFAAWADRTRKRAVIARIFNISGPRINKGDSYALAAFILDALGGGTINIRAPHLVIRSYVAVRELMSLVFALLFDRTRQVTRFDSGGEPMELHQVARAVAEHFGGLPIDRPALDRTIIDRYVGDDRTYRSLLADQRIDPVPFARQVIETIEFLELSNAIRRGPRVAMDGPAW